MPRNSFRVTFETWVGDAHNTTFHEEDEVSNIDIVAVEGEMVALLQARARKGAALANPS